ncbi:hypothetical protein [Streptomyces sp. NBC_00354]|uniref:hypothetical protein n=1 Tax=Streptomyces sp. NBC_00354 TaxID=2975723 RepID=UPI002E275924
MKSADVRYGLAIAVAAAAGAALLTACGGDSGSKPLSLSGLTETADGIPDAGQDTCPLPYDIAKAAKAAGLNGEAGPGRAKAADGPAVATGEGGKRTKPDSPFGRNPGALVTCLFHIGEEDVEVHTVATGKPLALSPVTPVVQRYAAVEVGPLGNYMHQATSTKPGGAPVTTVNGNASSVHLELDGDGDAYLLVGIGAPETGSPARDGQRTTALAKALAGQLP